MLYLKEANLEDIEQEYDFITNTPENENGFTNPNFGCSRTEFERTILPGLIDAAQGIGLPEGWVPETEFFLWDDDRIVGLFRIRHYLTEGLASGAGHIGYGIRKEYRGRGYATEGLGLTIEKARAIIREDEIYMSVDKNNPASLRVQLKNGAVIHHEDETEYYTRILLSKGKKSIIEEFNALGLEGLTVTDLNLLDGSYVNLKYRLANGQTVQLLEDSKTYWGNQIEKPDSERCYGIVADEHYLLVCEYGCNGADPEIVIYKRR